jgi:hypothetical protein
MGIVGWNLCGSFFVKKYNWRVFRLVFIEMFLVARTGWLWYTT